MRLNYRNTAEDYAAHWEVRHPHSSEQSAQAHYSSWTTFWLLLALGSYLGFKTEHLFIAIVFATYLAYSLAQNIPYSKIHRRSIDSWARSQPSKEITLEIDESGLTEFIGDIVSFVPWKAVKGYIHVQKRLFLELTEGLWAIIPEDSITEESDKLQELLSLLKEHGIPNKTADLAIAHRR